MPSMGCGQAPGETGSRTIELESGTGRFIVSIPADYDQDHPYPMGFGFHGGGRTESDCQNGDCLGFQDAMENDVVLVYMKSVGTGWEQMEWREDNVAFFVALRAQLEGEFCIDTNRVFTAGTSSGAHFSNILGCRFGDRLLTSVPVAGRMFERENCAGPMAALLIHGIDDTSYEGGKEARDLYVAQNGCTATTVPDEATAHAAVQEQRDQMQGHHECIDYQGCQTGYPVRWCEHSEGGYDNSTHGWPSFGGDEIWSFVQSLE